MKKILTLLTITVVTAFAFTDNYSINENMVERYKAELESTKAFSFLTDVPSSFKYYNLETGNYMGRTYELNQHIIQSELAGGYGILRQHFVKVSSLFRDLNDTYTAGTIIASNLQLGRESIFWKNGDFVPKGYKVWNIGGFLFLIKDSYNDRKEIWKKGSGCTYTFNGSLEEIKCGGTYYSFKNGIVQLTSDGLTIYSKDSYMGYSLNRSNSLTKK